MSSQIQKSVPLSEPAREKIEPVTIEEKKKELLIQDLGWSDVETQETYYRLLAFKEDWESAEMEDYDEL